MPAMNQDEASFFDAKSIEKSKSTEASAVNAQFGALHEFGVGAGEPGYGGRDIVRGAEIYLIDLFEAGFHVGIVP